MIPIASRIKGITVEIGGDVSGLDKALKGVNKDIKDTQAQLKDVEKLLKLDPKNVELLDQKQRLLSKSAEQTADKYNKLKATLDSVTASNPKFDEWTKAQAGFAAETTKTEKALAELQKQQAQMRELGFAPDSSQMREVQAEIDKTTAKLAEIEKKSVETYEALGRPISIDQYDALQRELVESKAQMEAAQKASDSFNVTLERVNVTAGQVSEKAEQLAQKTAGLSTAGVAVASALGAMAVAAGKTADDLNTLSKQSGFSTDLIQQWQYAADLIDVDSETIIAAARKMKANMTSTSADVVAAWEKLGITVYDNNGKLKDAETMFMSTVGALSLVRDETERDILAMTIFGRRADELAGIIDDGGQDLRYYGQQARDLGLILSQDALDGANKFNDGLTTIKAQAQAAFTEAGASLAENLLPELEKLVGWVEKVVTWFANLDGGTLKVIGTVALLVAAIAPILTLISKIGGAVEGVTSIAKLFSSAASSSAFFGFAKWGLIIMGVVAAIAALVAIIGVLTGKGDQIKSTLASVGNTVTGYGNNLTANYGAAGAMPSTQYGGATAGNYNALTTPTYGTATMTSSGISRATGAGRGYDTGPITRGGAQDIVINITDTIDGQTLARNTYRYNQDEAARRGTAAVR